MLALFLEPANLLFLEILLITMLLLVVLLINNIALYHLKLRDSLSIMLALSILVCAFEILWLYVDLHPEHRVLVYISRCGYMICFVSALATFCRYSLKNVGLKFRSKWMNFLVYGFPGFILLVLSIFTPIIAPDSHILYWFNDNGVIRSGFMVDWFDVPLQYVYVIVAMALTLIRVVTKGKYDPAIRNIGRSMLIFGVIGIGVTVVQYLLIVQYRNEYWSLSLPWSIALVYLTANLNTRRVMEEKAQAAVMEEASKAKSAFLANMSHEIRTPINAVLGMNEMILRECEDRNITKYAANIKAAGGNLLGIVNDVLDFSKIEAGKMEIMPVDYDMAFLINDLTNMIQTKIDTKGLDLVLDINSEIPKKLKGDEVRIKQIITNLLTNAVKYTEKGTVTFGVNFEKNLYDPDSIWLEVYVKDTGIGIRAEDMDRLYTEFERIEEKRNRNIEGAGLGLSITRSLLELMGSSLLVKSVYGAGSTFSFRLKQSVIKWEPMGDYQEAYRQSLAKRNKYKEKFIAPQAQVLLVDDNEMNRIVFQSLIKETRVHTDMAASGDEGLVLSRRKKYDIIFLDHLMPNKDGIETLRELRAEPDNPNLNTPTISLTANAISGAREQYISAGFDDYLTKPVDPDALENMLMEYLPEELMELPAHGDNEASKEASVSDDIPEELSFLKGQDVIDVRMGLKYCVATKAYLTALKVYYDSIPGKMQELDRFLEQEAFEDYTIKVHALKSSLRLIGATGMGEKAQQLENAGKTKDPYEVKKYHTDFKEACLGLRDILSNLPEV